MKKNILIADDDMEILEIMKFYLSEIANVTMVCNGSQALQQARLQYFDVILLDIEMPIMNGFQTLEQLRKLEECINTPVIMLTGRRDKNAVMNSIAMGIDGYLIKPVNKEELIQKIEEVSVLKQKYNNRKNILAIDDDMSYLKLLNTYLQEDYNLVMINSTKLALDYLASHVPDLILLDYQMPMYNGVALLNILRQNGALRNIPFIVLSGSVNKEAVMDFYAFDPADFLTKPVSKEKLLESIKQVLERR